MKAIPIEKKENVALETAITELAQMIARWTDKGDLKNTGISGLELFKRTEPTEHDSNVYEPSICLSAQGSKRVVLGSNVYVYDPRHFLLSSLHLPTMVQVVKATPEKPLLGIFMKLDRREISQLMIDGRLPAPRDNGPDRGMALGKVTLPLVIAFQRLIGLLDEPNDIPVLAPIIQREIFYRLLVSDQGAHLRQMAMAGTQTHQVAQAVSWLKDNFKQPLHIEALASQVSMSPSTFHHHFRALTAKSPLQYQKWMRLTEARRLMLIDRMDATTASVQVGYESASQFSREYSRTFGSPPLRDIAKLRKLPNSKIESPRASV